MRPERYGPFGYPLAGRTRERPLVATWVLVMLGFLVPVLVFVPLVPLVGYLMRVVDATARGESAPSVGRDPRGLLVGGLVGVVVSVAYLVGPVIALVATVYGAATRVEGPTLTTAEQLILYGGSTVVLSLFLLAAFVLPAALAVYERRGSVWSAFAPATLRPVVGHGAYFARWMAAAVALSFAAGVASVALQIHRIGPIVASLLLAYGLLVTAHLWGLGVRRARRF